MRAYLVKTVADAAELWGELARGTDDGLEEAFCDLQEVPLVLLQVLTLFQPGNIETSARIHKDSQDQQELFLTSCSDKSLNTKHEDFSWNFSLVKQKLLTKHLRPQESWRRTCEKPRRVLNREECQEPGGGPIISPGGIHLKADVVRGGDDRSQ